jgi:hypothetical protein
MCSLTPPPPFPLAGVLSLQASSSSPFFPHNTLHGAPPGCLIWSARGFSLTSGTYFSLSEFFFSFDFDMVYAVTLLSISDLVGLATL